MVLDAQKWPRASWGGPRALMGPLGAPKGPKNAPMGARGRPLGLGPYGPYVGPSWALCEAKMVWFVEVPIVARRATFAAYHITIVDSQVCMADT